MLEDQLFQKQECPLVVDSLAHLHLGDPQMGRVRFLAVVALQILHRKLHNETLLKESVVQDFLLHCHFNLNSPRMRLCPDKSSINKFHSLEAFNEL